MKAGRSDYGGRASLVASIVAGDRIGTMVYTMCPDESPVHDDDLRWTAEAMDRLVSAVQSFTSATQFERGLALTNFLNWT